LGFTHNLTILNCIVKTKSVVIIRSDFLAFDADHFLKILKTLFKLQVKNRITVTFATYLLQSARFLCWHVNGVCSGVVGIAGGETGGGIAGCHDAS
jgi:hypothetical protein